MKNRILLIDDDLDYLHILKGAIHDTIPELIIDFAEDDDALNKFIQSHSLPSLIFIDYELCTFDDANGINLFKKLKKLKNDIKAYLVTGYNKQELFDEFLKAGGTGYIKKDSFIKDILEIITKNK